MPSLNRTTVQLYLIKFAAFYLGCLGCFILQVQWNISPILAAAALGFLVTFVPLPSGLNPQGVQIAFSTGTFAGMSSPRILESPWHILVASLIGALIYILSKPYFTGIGGKMGAMAFFAVVVLLLLKVLL